MQPETGDRIVILLLILGALAVMDIMTSSWIIQLGGTELNILMAPVAGEPLSFLVVKSIYLVGLILLVRVSGRFHPYGPVAVLLTACGVTMQGVVWNSLLLWLHT
ncbi:MAG: DUF5658 family protein [Methanomicrobiales archaeon]|nr:DUF5658 family protein [Methanomicrobiales archaeon]